MSNSSRVPLLVGNKGRKPSRLPIAPRARPSNVDRAKRPASSEEPSSEPAPATDSAPATLATAAPHSPERKALPPVLPIAVTTPRSSSSAASSTATTTAPRSAGGISPGHSISVSRLGTFRAAPSVPVGQARASPQLAPTGTPGRVGVSPVERLAKITSKTVVPLFRPQEPRTHASPILGPRATPIPAPHGPSSEHPEPNPMLKRLTRKLDIKPHQSPRRAALNQHSGSTPLGASPLILPAPALEVPPELLDELKNEPAQKKRGTKRRSPSSTPRAPKKASSKKPVAPRRSIRRKVKKDDSYMDPGDSQDEDMQVGDSDESDDYDDDDDEAEEEEGVTTTRGRTRRRRIKLPDVDNPPVYMPARERATLWAKKVLEAAENGEPVDDASKKESRKRSNSTSSVTSLSTSATTNSRKTKAEERLKKEPSQMTMGELALSIPKGRRMLRHEQEENADTTNNGTHGNRIRSLSMSSETPSFGAGSIVTPQVEIIDGKMVILEAAVKLNEHSTGSEYGDDSTRRVRGSRQAAAAAPGKRWGKEETKQFYYCLSQVGPNFSMMATLFPSRKRKELKSKFKYEEKHHPDLIEIALQASAAPLDSEIVDVIGQMADKEIKKQEEKKRRKHSTDSLDDGLHSPATVSSSAVVPSPSPDETMDFDDEEVGELYRERKGSFDFAG